MRVAVCAVAMACGLIWSSPASGRPSLPGVQRLSDESDVTFSANAAMTAPVYTAPRKSARKFARLRWATEDGFPEVYVLLLRWQDPKGQEWLRVRIPQRPNGQQGWVKAQALAVPRVVRTLLVIDRRHLRATLFRKRRRVWSSPVGVGKPGTPTPAGHFWIRERMRLGDSRGIYGPLAFGTSAYSSLSDWPGGGVIGIHGTNAPALIPGRPSHGCVRVPNRSIQRLGELMPTGTPVRIV